MLKPTDYQERGFEALESYLRLCTQHGAKTAFIHQTERPYKSVPQLPALPYVCLRIPTGGGKTLMACHTVGIIADSFLQAERAVCLWLVPTTTIREQTLKALRDRKHHYREALDSRFSGKVTVLDLSESLYVQHGTLIGETVVIVSTLAALRRDDTEGLKVYEPSGALQHHFTGLTAALEAQLERREDGTIPQSLCNVLRLWRPAIIMDEAHNARTPLSFETLARFNPSCIVEFTATPETDHNPEQGYFASNVLYHVSAAELKTAQMVKLPIKLETRGDWNEVVSEALRTRRELEALARQEEQQTGEYIRPIVLFQAQPKSQTKATLTVEVVKKALIEDHKIAEDEIAVATGDMRGLDKVDLFDRACKIKYIITVQALKEGWDCSFAYVLCSVADMGSAKAVEQLLGRVLRLPHARWKKNEALNCAYAFAASARFIEVAQSLKDALVENGFQRIEADELVKPAETQRTFADDNPLFVESSEPVGETPNFDKLPSDLRGRVTFDRAAKTLIVTGVVSDSQKVALANCFEQTESKQAVERIYHRSHGRHPAPSSSQAVKSIKVPALAVRIDGELEMFEESHFLDSDWKLSEQPAALTEDDFPSEYVSGQAGELDVSDQGNVEIRFVDQVQRQIQLMGFEPGWDIAGLSNWLDRQIPHPDITRTESTLFIHGLLDDLIATRKLTVEQLAQQKYRLRLSIAEKIDQRRKAAKANAFNRMLFSTEAAEIEVSPDVCFEFTQETYPANWYCETSYIWKRHLTPLVGELKGEGEEYDCAVFLDQLPGVKRWVRNLERRVDTSFWLQTATDRFYPDFVALLDDGRILVIEYKGRDRWSNDDSREKRAIAELWENRSAGQCLFIMPNGPDWQAIRAKIRAK